MILHEGLVLLIMEHVKDVVPPSIINGKEKILSEASSSSGLDTSIVEEEEWNEEDEDGSLAHVATSLKKIKKGSLKSKRVAKCLILNELDSHFDHEDTKVGSSNSTPKNKDLEVD